MMDMNVLSMCPTKCNGAEETQCYGGRDSNGCMQPEFCWPYKGGPVGNDGYECPFHCPTKCDADYMQCPEGEDGNGCR